MRERFSNFNVVAALNDMASARQAITALERAGIEAGDISLLGRAAAEAAGDTDPRERDAGVARDVSTAAAVGTGAGAGALAGLIGGALPFGIPGLGPVVGSGIWAATLGGAGMGAAIGGLMGGTAVLGQDETWAQTYAESVRAGNVLVAVSAGCRDEIETAARVRREQAPVALDFVDAHGQRLD